MVYATRHATPHVIHHGAHSLICHASLTTHNNNPTPKPPSHKSNQISAAADINRPFARETAYYHYCRKGLACFLERNKNASQCLHGGERGPPGPAGKERVSGEATAHQALPCPANLRQPAAQ